MIRQLFKNNQLTKLTWQAMNLFPSTELITASFQLLSWMLSNWDNSDRMQSNWHAAPPGREGSAYEVKLNQSQTL